MYSFTQTESSEPSPNIELNNANTISTTTPPNEQIDNAELQDKETVSNGLDDNENDEENKTDDGTNTAPVAVDLNNGTITEEPYVAHILASLSS